MQEPIVLAGKQVYRLRVDLTALQTKGEKPRPYWRGKYNGIGLMIDDQAFVDAFAKGEVTEVTLAEGTRERDDTANPGSKVSVPTLTFGSYMTKTQDLSMSKHIKEVAAIESPAQVELSDDLVAALQQRLLAPATK